MIFLRLLMIVAVALPLSACITTAEQLAADDDAACRHAGLKPGTPAYAKCREDRAGQRNMLQAAAMRNQQTMFQMQQANMMQQQTLMMMRHY